MNNSKDRTPATKDSSVGSNKMLVMGLKEQTDVITNCMSGPFNDMVFRYRYFLIVFLFFIGIGGLIVASQIGPMTEDQPMLPEDHPQMVIQRVITEDFSAASGQKDSFLVSIVWGVKDLDRSSVGLWDPASLGNLVWDNKFTIEPAENQQAILDLCDDLRDNSELVKDNEVICWMHDFDEYVKLTYAGRLNLPIGNPQMLKTLLDQFLKTEKGLEYIKGQHLGFDPSTGELITTRIQAMSVGKPRAPRADKLPIYEQWEEYLEKFRQTAPEGLKHVFQYADIFWCFMVSELAFYEGAIQGMIVSVSLAFLIMLLATQNLFVTIYSIIAVMFIVAGVTAIMVLAGWELGVIESVATVIVIGFSVDYVVHLAAHYVHSPYQSRTDKAKESISAMGISIFSGAITTLGSGVFLFGGTIVFFQKFALVIVFTVTLSLVYALLYFMAFLYTFGPNGKMGDICIFWRAFVETWRESGNPTPDRPKGSNPAEAN